MPDDNYDNNDFYEEDEPVGALLAAYDAGEKVVTEMPPPRPQPIAAASNLSVTHSRVERTVERGIRVAAFDSVDVS